MASRTPPSGEDAAKDDGAGLVAHLLGAGSTASTRGLFEGVVASWADERGLIEHGVPARLGASCLLRPAAGDLVLAWRGADECWILSVLERTNEAGVAVITASGANLAIQAGNITLTGKAVHIAAEDFLTSTRNRHAVENTRTEVCKVRVSRVGTDIRRVTTADEEVSGTLLQRTGTWLSVTVRDARLRARTFLFD